MTDETTVGQPPDDEDELSDGTGLEAPDTSPDDSGETKPPVGA